MNKSIKVLHVLNTNTFSGAENVATQIINLCRKEGIESIYCSPIGKIQSALRDRNINYYPIVSLSVKNLKHVIEDFKPDIIHAHDRRATLIACICSKKIPIISHLHGKFMDMKKISLNNIMYSIAALKVNKIICVSNSINQEWILSKFFKNKISIVRNVIEIDTNLYNNLTLKYDICFIGRLVYEKNIPRLLKILKRLNDQNPSFKAVICGDGKEREYLTNFINTNKLNQSIEYKGFVNDPLKYIAQSKLMIMTSRTEGTPMVALESLLLGKPIISTPTDGLTEIIMNKKNGFLSDNDDEIIKYIQSILDNEKLYEQLCLEVMKFNLKINDVTEYKNYFISLYKNII